ncbi:MAG: hypothetical protein IPK17_19425 [Chloroflexi bacterium]|uniref:hypothetical protein n=1 Tax=Candidatus Flexifilum breve TaxID=3140694 RepID=UPI003136CAE1|nr:hypothetical protein [Chloroflexota bacterium]
MFQWVAKIYYGILFRELSLLRDRKDASQGFIFTEEQLQEFATLHHFLQSVRLPFVFRGFQPWSMFILRILDHPIDLAFDYHDLLSPMVFGIRMGEIGLIVVLEDSGVQEVISKHYFEEIDLLSLHRIQFDEVFANVVYGASLMNRTVKYMVSMPNNLSRPTEVVQMPLMGLSSKPILDEWEPKVYAEVLSVYMERYGMTLHDVFPSSQAIWSIIHNQNDELLQLDIDGKLVKTLSPLSGEPDEDEDTIRV